jgi:hypothetical protein
MWEFDEFLENLELMDLPLTGRNFTWFHPNGVTMSRLDRILVSSSWCEIWGDPFVRVLDRDVADHCPLVLNCSSVDWGPKPFRFNNFWLQNREFKRVITEAWGLNNFEGWMGFILKEKLKSLKGVIKEWSRNTYGVWEDKKRLLIKRIADLDSKSERVGLGDEEVVERKASFDELWKLLKNLDALAFQRSRHKWLKEGDANSRFFHNCIKARKRRNMVLSLRTPDGWVEGPNLVRREVVSFFTNHFSNCR